MNSSHQASATLWLPIASAPRDGRNVLLRFGQDGVSQGKYIPGLPHPWLFIDTQDGLTWLLNHAVDGPGGPSHWQPLPDAASALVGAFDEKAISDAAGEAFNNLFHKSPAEVSMLWWQRIWRMGVDWARAAAMPGDEAGRQAMIDWTVGRWHDEVANRPLVNVHRRSLDGTWRQVLAHLGIDHRARLGPTHDELAADSARLSKSST